MKNGTVYAARLKKVYAELCQSLPTPEIPEPDDPIRRIGIAILGVASSDVEAERAIDRALETMVDWNEIRVSSAFELNKATGNVIPQGVQRCQSLIDALQAVYDCENRLSLDALKGIGRRDARHYLEKLDGVDEYVVASVLLWSLGGHAIPVNDGLLQNLRDADLVNPSSDRAEVQAFLERHVSAADAKAFCVRSRSFAAPLRPRSRRAKAKGDIKTSGVLKSE